MDNAERCGSAAPGSGSAADAGRRRLQPVVRRGFWEGWTACLCACSLAPTPACGMASLAPPSCPTDAEPGALPAATAPRAHLVASSALCSQPAGKVGTVQSGGCSHVSQC